MKDVHDEGLHEGLQLSHGDKKVVRPKTLVKSLFVNPSAKSKHMSPIGNKEMSIFRAQTLNQKDMVEYILKEEYNKLRDALVEIKQVNSAKQAVDLATEVLNV